jgi:hypothetical protein
MQLMHGTWKFAPWLLLITGVLWVLTVLRNVYAPEFLSFTHLPRVERMSLAPLQLAAGALCIVAGMGGLRRSKR